MKVPKIISRVDCLIVSLEERKERQMMENMRNVAPEMLEALKAANAALRIVYNDLTDSDARKVAIQGMNECLLAIAKAKGAIK